MKRLLPQVKAWDSDGSSPNNAVVYRIQRGAEDKFVIDADTGVISVAHGASLDPDRTDPKTNHYSLRVVALDGGIGSEQRAAAVDVNISIVDVNNKAPILLDPGSIHVKENTQVAYISKGRYALKSKYMYSFRKINIRCGYVRHEGFIDAFRLL
jgi:hypothetical protein